MSARIRVHVFGLQQIDSVTGNRSILIKPGAGPVSSYLQGRRYSGSADYLAALSAPSAFGLLTDAGDSGLLASASFDVDVGEIDLAAPQRIEDLPRIRGLNIDLIADTLGEAIAVSLHPSTVPEHAPAAWKTLRASMLANPGQIPELMAAPLLRSITSISAPLTRQRPGLPSSVTMLFQSVRIACIEGFPDKCEVAFPPWITCF